MATKKQVVPVLDSSPTTAIVDSGLTKTGSKSRNPDPREGLETHSKIPDQVLCRNGNRLFGSHGCGKGDVLPKVSGSGIDGLAEHQSSDHLRSGAYGYKQVDPVGRRGYGGSDVQKCGSLVGNRASAPESSKSGPKEYSRDSDPVEKGLSFGLPAVSSGDVQTDARSVTGVIGLCTAVSETGGSEKNGTLGTHDRPPQRGFSQSWAPKKGTITEPHDHDEISQIEHNGVAAIDVRSSKGVTGDSIAAA